MLAKVSRSQSSHFEQIGRFKVWKTSNKRLRAGATLRTTAGDLLALEEEIIIGSSPDCQLQVQGTNIGGQHARIFSRNGRIFCRAMVGNEEDVSAETFTWLVPDKPLRAGVEYMLSPGDQLAFGESTANVATVEFDAVPSEGFQAIELMMDAMVAGSSDEVKAALQESRNSAKNQFEQLTE